MVSPLEQRPLEVDATSAELGTGQECGGGIIPLVGMALTAIKAADLAAQGDDWRNAFRTHPDAYQQYQREKAKNGGISIGDTADNK